MRLAPTLCLLTGLCAGAGALAAQPPERPYEPVQPDPLSPRLIEMPTPYTVGARRIEVLFKHRFQQTVSKGSSNLWGLDSGADVGIGFGFGLGRHFDLSVMRASFQKDFEFAGKFLVLEQAERVPVSLALRAGTDLLRQAGVDDPNRPFGQIIVARAFGHGVNLIAAPTWVRDTPQLRDAVNVPVGLSVGFLGGTYLEGEYVPKNRDLKGSVAGWHVALMAPVGNHRFTIVVGNSRAMTVDQSIGGDSAAGFKAGDVRLGFNLVRNFDY
jgi:uncharacterized beta barrel domain-containing protein DUF5777